MANALLDFVMSVVREPDVAARYAQDPAQAIADAHLTGVTSADVNNLIPVVSESLSMSAPAFGGADVSTAADGNIWASGAATAAFDAFADHVPDAGHAVMDPVGSVVDTGTASDAGTVSDAGADLPALDPVFDQPMFDDVVDPVAPHVTEPLDHGLADHPAPGFDIFE